VEDLKETVHFFFDSLRYDHADPQLCLLAPLAETPIQTKHRNALIFDDIISDMSFQGWEQDPLDKKMIEAHPDIFPNFYSVPTPHLDRPYLKELREFVLNGMIVCRWLLVGLHQDSGNLLDVFSTWREWRQKKKEAIETGNAARYYAGAAFLRDFLEFVRSQYIPYKATSARAIATLADYESAFSVERTESVDGGAPSDTAAVEPSKDFGGLISSRAIPVLVKGVAITRVDADYKKIVECLRRKRRLDSIRSRAVTLVTRESSDKETEILQLSNLSADLLSLCTGSKSVADISAEFVSRHRTVKGVPSEKACILGLELLRRQGMIVIGMNQTCPSVAESHPEPALPAV
jgi:hypothetical protein